MTKFYFLRVNGETKHNDAGVPLYYVPNEPPPFPTTYFNYLSLCFERNFVRIGWPDTGDLSAPSKTGALARGYSLDMLQPYVQEYLRTYSRIDVGSTVVVPDKARSGDLYICEVTRPYHYFHNVPDEPYECAHRLGVKWDRDAEGHPIRYRAEQLNISTSGFWRRAFHDLTSSVSGRSAIQSIEAIRAAKDMRV